MSIGVIVPGCTVINLMGQELRIPPPTMDDWGSLVAYIREQVPNPVPSLVRELSEIPRDLALELFREAQREYSAKITIGPEDGIRYAFSTPAGFARLLWLLLERTQPGQFSPSQVFGAVADKAFTDPDGFAADLERVGAIAGLPKLGAAIAKERREAAHQALPNLGNAPTGDSAGPSNTADLGSPPANSAG